MIKSIGGKAYNVDTPEEKTIYTIAVIKYNKIQKERKRQRDADYVTNRLKERFMKRGQI
ncbi:hypothetical protein [Clostridium sp. DMHC 10]|uniref:hypothetical protein n=1 Tax=Clostridium sp. DMHC 10 TaxID=747377 RepID=UPI000AE9081F|nr:hypothetical protein [Clostridium sp. DMHC 10]